MNTKEAIEFIENGIDLSTRELEKEYLKKMDGVISLLQQGEAYKKITKKIKGKYGHTIVEWTGNCKTLKEKIRELEQKYLEEAKSDGR